MQIERITVKFGMTQNLGDYSNVRPEVEVTAVLGHDEDFEDAVGAAIHTARDQVRELVDDELEKAGREPKYYAGRLFRVSYAEKRKLVVIYPAAGEDLPPAENWQEQDRWQRCYDLPSKMRPDTAWPGAQQEAGARGYTLLDCRDGNYSVIPGLPDPGPEPSWHAKALKSDLQRLRIPEAYWDGLGELAHVDRDYLLALYHEDLEQEPLELRLDVIRTGRDFKKAGRFEHPDLVEESDDDDDDIAF